jgi:hypothetical protein
LAESAIQDLRQQLAERQAQLTECRHDLQLLQERTLAAEQLAQQAEQRLAQLGSAYAEAMQQAAGLAQELTQALAVDEERLHPPNGDGQQHAKSTARRHALAAAAERSLLVQEFSQLAQVWKDRDQEEAQRYQALLARLDDLDQRLAAAAAAANTPAIPPLGFVPDPAVILDLQQQDTAEPHQQQQPPPPSTADVEPQPLLRFPPAPHTHGVPTELREWLLGRCRDLPRLAARLERLLDELDSSTQVWQPWQHDKPGSDARPAREREGAISGLSECDSYHGANPPFLPGQPVANAGPTETGADSSSPRLLTRFMSMFTSRAR